MSKKPERATPNNAYPRDVTSPGPAQRRFVVRSRRVGNARPASTRRPAEAPRPAETPRPEAPEKRGESTPPTEQQLGC